jgi:hypothetical protein
MDRTLRQLRFITLCEQNKMSHICLVRRFHKTIHLTKIKKKFNFNKIKKMSEDKEIGYAVTLTLTAYTNEYQGSKLDGPYFFSTRKRANAYLCRRLVDLINNEYYTLDEIRVEHHQYFDNSCKLKNEFSTNFHLVCELMKPINDGKYVNSKFDWDITRIHLDVELTDEEMKNV